MTLHYSLDEVTPYINWIYFFHAWGISNRPQSEQHALQDEATQRLQRHITRYRTHAVFCLCHAFSDGDDIVTEVPAAHHGQRCTEVRIPCLRQQQQDSEYLCLSDFIAPKTNINEKSFRQIGLFATTVDSGMECDFDDDPYEKMMMQLLADRLAEATAERLHEQVRKHYWGYAADEQLSISDMLSEHWQGIRPAVGYPSLPDTSLNFLFDQVLDLSQIGIRLTESGAMKPHASVSGMMLAHPKARYFSIGKIGQDQLYDYARRRGISLETAKKFLSANL